MPVSFLTNGKVSCLEHPQSYQEMRWVNSSISEKKHAVPSFYSCMYSLLGQWLPWFGLCKEHLGQSRTRPYVVNSHLPEEAEQPDEQEIIVRGATGSRPLFRGRWVVWLLRGGGNWKKYGVWSGPFEVLFA